jgi:hypothetical protein
VATRSEAGEAAGHAAAAALALHLLHLAHHLFSTAAFQHLHHLLHLLELLQELVHLDDLHARTIGDAHAAAAVEDVGLLALLLRHREDDVRAEDVIPRLLTTIAASRELSQAITPVVGVALDVSDGDQMQPIGALSED